MNDQQQRVEIVNQIIVEIASRGRGFFKHDDKIAKLQLTDTGKICYIREWVPDLRTPVAIWVYGAGADNYKRFWHGQTLHAIIEEFVVFIINGQVPIQTCLNGHFWGYEPEDITAIKQKAVDLGYLKLSNRIVGDFQFVSADTPVPDSPYQPLFNLGNYILINPK